MEVDFRPDTGEISLRQTAYLRVIVKEFDFLNGKTSPIPMTPGFGNILKKSDDQATSRAILWYQSAIGSLIWPAMHTRLNISYAVEFMAKFAATRRILTVSRLKRFFAI